MLDLNIKKFDIYILKEFIKAFVYIASIIYIMIFFVDFLEVSKKAEIYNIKFVDIIRIAAFRVPSMIEDILQFIILMASIFTLTNLSRHSELVVMANSKYPLLRLLFGEAVFVGFAGILFNIFVNPFFCYLKNQSQLMENRYIENYSGDYIKAKEGIWLKQSTLDENLQETGELILRAQLVYTNEVLFKNVIFIFTDNNGLFIKRINSKYAKLLKDSWLLTNNIVISPETDMEYVQKITIPTKLTKKFVIQKLTNKYKSINTISFWKLGVLIKNFEESGLDSTKFRVRRHMLILRPLMLTIMIMIAGIYTSISSRLKDYILNIGKTVLAGFIIFVIQNILSELSNSGLINIYLSTWFLHISLFLIALIILIKKTELPNIDDKKSLYKL